MTEQIWWEINRIKRLAEKRKPEVRPNVDYTPASITLNAGTLTGGTVADVQEMFGGTTYDLDEVAATPGFDVEFVFTGVTKNVRLVICRYLYNGSATHYVGIDLWNYDSTAWDQHNIFKDTGGYYACSTKAIPLNIAANYRDAGGNAIVRMYHYTAGNNSHDIKIDYVGLTH